MRRLLSEAAARNNRYLIVMGSRATFSPGMSSRKSVMAFPAYRQYRFHGNWLRVPARNGTGETVEVLMKRTGWRPRWAAVAAAGLAVAAVGGPVAAAGAAPATGARGKGIAGPNMKPRPPHGRPGE